MRRPDNITTMPSAFWPFVIVDFAFGIVSGVLEGLHYYQAVRVVIAIGIPPNIYFAYPAFFVPSFAAKKTGFRPGSEVVWLRNAGLLIWIITAAHVMAAVHPQRWSEVVWLTVGGRLAAGVYWVIVATSKPAPKEFPVPDTLG
jgi:hypothetical protein